MSFGGKWGQGRLLDRGQKENKDEIKEWRQKKIQCSNREEGSFILICEARAWQIQFDWRIILICVNLNLQLLSVDYGRRRRTGAVVSNQSWRAEAWCPVQQKETSSRFWLHGSSHIHVTWTTKLDMSFMTDINTTLDQNHRYSPASHFSQSSLSLTDRCGQTGRLHSIGIIWPIWTRTHTHIVKCNPKLCGSSVPWDERSTLVT